MGWLNTSDCICGVSNGTRGLNTTVCSIQVWGLMYLHAINSGMCIYHQFDGKFLVKTGKPLWLQLKIGSWEKWIIYLLVVVGSVYASLILSESYNVEQNPQNWKFSETLNRHFKWTKIAILKRNLLNILIVCTTFDEKTHKFVNISISFVRSP